MNFDLLTTEGGKLVVIVFMLVLILGVVLILVLSGHPLQEVGRDLATGAVGSLLTLLYQYLQKGK